MSSQNDGLFLLEALVDKIVFVKSPCFSDKDFRTCVNIECPNVEPLEICDDEPNACIAKSSGPFIKLFNNGKSCLFSLKESDISTAMSKFPIKVTVFKSLPCGCLPTKIIMGECTIDMTKEFVEARNTFLEDPTNVSYQALKDSFRIVGPEGEETGEIVMFLRISCFGNMIITRFQGPGGPPNIGGENSSMIVDRSCAPRKDFQSMQDPCVCGAARGTNAGGGAGGGHGQPCNMSGGSGVCPQARDPYNSMPCQDPDDPCFCSGPKQPPKQQMVCRNTDQYCLHVPKGILPRLPNFQELTKEPNINNTARHNLKRKTTSSLHLYNDVNGWKIFKGTYQLPLKLHNDTMSNITFRSEESDKRFTLYNKVDNTLESYNSTMSLPMPNATLFNTDSYGLKDTFVYMTLSNNLNRQRSSATQATASINKCFQVYNDWTNNAASSTATASTYHSTCTMSTFSYRKTPQVTQNIRYPRVYFFGRKKDEKKQKGMGPKTSKTKLQRTSQTSNTGIKTGGSKTSVTTGSNSNVKSSSTTTKSALPPNASKTAATTAGSAKTVTIKEDKPQKPCPALGTTKGDMMVTVSHIKIGPKEACPVHGNEPCQGPKCILASSGEEQAPVKITSMNNPRRGVFEVVIRRLTGAPLAKNELMLEWTPPPSRPPPCGGPCPTTCFPPGPFRPSKCKLIVCRTSTCRPKCPKKKRCPRPPCGTPCGTPCKKCCKPAGCGKTCFPPCKPCPPPRCSRCTPPVCSRCTPSGCGSCAPPICFKPPCSPCKSSPCLRPCPVGYKRPRKCKSQPKIKTHKKRKSPCANSSKACPIVRCRSIPGPCLACCNAPPICFPRKCCSVLPCKPPKCISSCSTCCG